MVSNFVRASMSLGLAAIALTGCGRDVGLTPARPARLVTSTRPARVPGQALPMPAGVPAGPTGVGTGVTGATGPVSPAARLAVEGITGGERLLEAQRKRLETVQSFEASIRSFSQGNYQGGKRTEERKRATSEMKLTWARPARLRVEVLKTTNPIAEGALLVTQDTINCRVRAKGLLGFFPLSMPATDSRLANNRNHTLPEINPKVTLERLTAPGAAWTVVGDDVVEGTPVKVVRVAGVKPLDEQVTGEIIAVDPVAAVVRKVTMYADREVVGEHTMQTFRWNPPVTAATFEI